MLSNHVTYKYGAGDPVVFIHGIEEDGTFWYPVDRATARFRSVLTLDLLGYGRSPKGRALTYTMAEHVGAVHSTLDEVGLEGKFTLVAHSLGCYVAAGFAEEYPERIKRLILVSPVVITKTDLGRKDSALTLLQKVMLGNVSNIRKTLEESVKAKGVSPIWRKIVRNFWPSVKNVENLVEKQDFPAAMKKLKKVPTEIVYGAGDPLIIPENIEALKKANPKLKTLELPVGHDVIHMAPVQLFKVIIPEVKDTQVPDVIYRKLWRR